MKKFTADFDRENKKKKLCQYFVLQWQNNIILIVRTTKKYTHYYCSQFIYSNPYFILFDF